MEQFKRVVNVAGGDLEKEYNALNATLQKSEAGAAEVRSRVRAVEEVSEALFDEWRAEIKQYNSDALRDASQKKLGDTRARYTQLITAMKLAESKLEPVLMPLRDHVLFMKHNLNARAISGLGSELGAIQANVDTLVHDMESAIAEADAFIETLRNAP
jgi:capsule polysaccharide export protein KpsE/RkpR